MYSRNYSSRQRQYPGEGLSDSGGSSLSLPPRYGGVRFGKAHRNDGRDEVFERSFVPMARENHEGPLGENNGPSEGVTGERIAADSEREKNGPAQLSAETGEGAGPDILLNEDGGDGGPEVKDCADRGDKGVKKSKIGDLFSDFGQDDILIVALIVLLASQGSENNRDIILLLALLLCFR